MEKDNKRQRDLEETERFARDREICKRQSDLQETERATKQRVSSETERNRGKERNAGKGRRARNFTRYVEE